MKGQTRRMTFEDKSLILKQHLEGLTNIAISKIVGFSNTAIRMYLKKQGLKSNTAQRDRSRPCQVCNIVFVPKTDDGIAKNKYLNCSLGCSLVSKKQKRRSLKYTDHQLSEVISLKEKLYTNSDIETITGVNLNTVKAIVKENKLQLTPQDAQRNAYKKKIEKNPNAMCDMRNKHHTKYTIEVFQEYAKEHHGVCLSEEYITTKQLEWQCNQKHTWDAGISILYKKSWCPKCNVSSSAQESEVLDFVKGLVGLDCPVEQGNREILKGKEVDIYIPSLHIGIEYCGLYWHSELNNKTRQYHFDKMKQCNQEKIRLITIFEDEWLERREQVKGYLQSVLGTAEKRIFARKCTIKEVDKNTAKDFLERYHIQGKTIFKVAFGLYYCNELMGLVTGNTHHRQRGDSPPFVLNRLVFKKGVLIVGGSSRLLKYLIKYTKDSQYSELISWSDNRWSEGNVYNKTGFTLVEHLGPDYSYYVGGNKRQSKQSNQKKNLITKGAKGTLEDKEKELASSLGYSRIWDCGKKRWKIHL